MKTSTNVVELYQIINSEHGNPHHILGMHKVTVANKEVLSVRTFIPQAQSVSVVDPKKKMVVYEMKKIHEDGFFETIIYDRSEWFRYKFLVQDFTGCIWNNYDAYSFEPQISELDLHLFGEGTHYEIYEKLGAHPWVVDGISGTLFAVWAPNAKRVSVVGDFNAWDGRRNPMRILGNSGVWELFIPSVTTFDKYKFEIKTNDNCLLQKTDPYGNFAELRPNTASVVYDLNNYVWHDKEWLSKRKKRDLKKSPINIYEVHLGSFKRIIEESNRSMTYRELADDLVSYVKKMGYTHIELMPILEHPFDGSWGYQVTGYFASTSRYGTPDDFMYFVDTCHRNDIGVFLDWVPAHFPKDAHGLARFDGTALYEHNDPRLGEHPDWGTLIFNYGRNEVKNFLIANAIFWIEKFHIDGLRVDAVASMLYLDYGKRDGGWIANMYGGNENLEAVEFLKHMNSVISGAHPDVLMIAEESTAWTGVSRPVEEGGLGFKLKWNMGWMNDFLRYISKDPIHRKYHQNDLTFSMVYAYTENFILVLSHDEVVHGKGSLIGKMPGDLWQKFANLRVAYGFMCGHPGKKLLFMGGEFGQFDEWCESKSLDWHLLEFEHHRQLQKYVIDLNAFYLRESALWENDFSGEGFTWIECSDYNTSVITFMRKGDSDHNCLFFVCNFTPVPHYEYRMGVPFDCQYKEIFNSDDLLYGGSGILNSDEISADNMEWNGRQFSIGIKVPPLGISVFRPVGLQA